jgi:large subunit ribosomal protein L23
MALFKKNTKKEEGEVKEVVKKAPKAKKEKVAAAAEAPVKRTSARTVLAATTLIAPLVTEKTAHLADTGVYAFRVPLSANRVAIREAFRELYKVTPVKINIMRVHGKETRFGRSESRESDWKKALITLPEGKRVDVFTL